MKFKLVLSVALIYSTSVINAQWIQTNGPYGGFVTSIGVNGTTLFACSSFGSGIFRSIDFGNTWIECNEGVSNRNVNSISIFKNKTYLGTGGGNLLESDDNGLTWNLIINTIAKGPAVSLAVNDSNLFIGTGAGEIIISNDNGNTWRSTGNVFGPSTITSIAFNDSNIFAGTDGYGIFRSTDNGLSWIPSRTGLTNGYVYSLITDGNEIYAGTFGSGVFKSTDNGINWTSFSLGLPKNNHIKSIQKTGESIYALSTSYPGNTNPSGIYSCNINEEKWKLVGNDLNPVSSTSFVILENKFFVSTLGKGVITLDVNNTNWVQVNNGLTFSCISHMIINGENLIVSSGLSNGEFYISTNKGDTWNILKTDFGKTEITSLTTNNNSMFVVTLSKGTYKSTDCGLSWTRIISLDSLGGIFALTSDGDFLVGGGGSGRICISTDNGMTWKPILHGLGIVAIETIAINGDTVFAGTYGSGIYRSTDRGSKWTDRIFGLQNKEILSIAFKGSSIFAGTLSSGIYLSQDGGLNWIPVNNGLFDLYIRSLWGCDQYIIASTGSNGSFISRNNGSIWEEMNEGLLNKKVESFVKDNKYLYASTWGSGIWKKPLSELTGIENNINNIVDYYSLSQNYPNPFNPSTTIKYSIPSVETRHGASLRVSLKVYDMLGRELTTLVNEEKTPGNYEVNFDGSNFSSGVYFYRLQTGSFTQTKKFVLMK